MGKVFEWKDRDVKHLEKEYWFVVAIFTGLVAFAVLVGALL